MRIDNVRIGNCLDVLKEISDESIDCCVTSPPYYGLRDYGTGTWVGGDPKCPHRRLSKHSDKTITGHKQAELAGNVGDAIYHSVCPLCGAKRVDKQIGLEETPEEYIQKLVDVFSEVKRVLKKDGTLWLNIGDSYNGSGNRLSNCKAKDLIGVPWMLAFALRNDGWYLRQDIIWHKPNPMPEPVKDRCVKSHEYIFLLSKNQHYYFDYEAIQEDCVSAVKEDSHIKFGGNKYGNNGDQKYNYYSGKEWNPTDKRNKRDVWSVTTKSVKEAHFATFPEDLIKPCILAGCRAGGVVLDPFFGSGTTGRVSMGLNRHYIGIELNPNYAEIANRRADEVQMTLDGFLSSF